MPTTEQYSWIAKILDVDPARFSSLVNESAAPGAGPPNSAAAEGSAAGRAGSRDTPVARGNGGTPAGSPARSLAEGSAAGRAGSRDTPMARGNGGAEGSSVDSALAAGSAAGRAGSLDTQHATLRKLGQIWTLAEATVRHDVESLRAALMKLYGSEAAAGAMAGAFQVHVDRIFAAFDGTLAKQLAAGAAAGAEPDLAKIKDDIRGTISAHMDFVGHDTAIAVMDENPLIKLNIAAFCRSTLDTMLRAIH